MAALHLKNWSKYWIGGLLVMWGALSFSLPPAQAKDIMVFAAASLALPLQQIADSFAAKANYSIRISLAGSATLARQIGKGAPADIYISANQNWMEYAARKVPLIAASRQHLLSNRMVLIGLANTNQPVSSLTTQAFSNLLQNGRLAIGDPDHVPAGIYAAEALKRLNLWPTAKLKLARMNNVRAALAMVERGATPAGIVYQTDAFKNSKVAVIYRFPASAHRQISYWAARVRDQNATNKAFFKFLFSSAAKAVFKRHGFLVN